MKHKLLALLFVTVIPLVGCLQKETSTTIYIRNDGTVEWAVMDQNVRSDEEDAGKHTDEERSYIDAISNGTDGLTTGFRTLGGTNIKSVVLRDRAPFATLRSADFEHLNQIWERALETCQVPHRLELRTDGLVTTWTLSIQLDPELRLPDDCDSTAMTAVLSDSDNIRITLESGKFVSVTGFKILSPNSVELDENVSEETIKANGGVLTFSLTWERKAH
jgi:hypothetical protein